MGNHFFFNGKTRFKWPFSIAMSVMSHYWKVIKAVEFSKPRTCSWSKCAEISQVSRPGQLGQGGPVSAATTGRTDRWNVWRTSWKIPKDLKLKVESIWIHDPVIRISGSPVPTNVGPKKWNLRRGQGVFFWGPFFMRESLQSMHWLHQKVWVLVPYGND